MPFKSEHQYEPISSPGAEDAGERYDSWQNVTLKRTLRRTMVISTILTICCVCLAVTNFISYTTLKTAQAGVVNTSPYSKYSVGGTNQTSEWMGTKGIYLLSWPGPNAHRQSERILDASISLRQYERSRRSLGRNQSRCWHGRCGATMGSEPWTSTFNRLSTR